MQMAGCSRLISLQKDLTADINTSISGNLSRFETDIKMNNTFGFFKFENR